MMTRAAIYARKSRPEGSSEDVEVANQLRELKDHCDKQGWTYEVFTDLVSGRETKKRPQFDRMLKEAFMRHVDIVLVWKVDRFARSMTDFIYAVQQLDSSGVRFISLTQGVDTNRNNPTGKLLMHMLAAFAEFESDLISERIKAGIERRRAEGKPIGRQRVDIDHKWVKELKNEDGLSIRAISKIVGCSRGTVHRLLKI